MTLAQINELTGGKVEDLLIEIAEDMIDYNEDYDD